jgi:hypothetical protein
VGVLSPLFLHGGLTIRSSRLILVSLNGPGSTTHLEVKKIYSNVLYLCVRYQ